MTGRWAKCWPPWAVIHGARRISTFILSKDGYDTVTTHIFDPDDDYIDSDAVFGVKDSLIAKFQPITDAGNWARWAFPGRFTGMWISISCWRGCDVKSLYKRRWQLCLSGHPRICHALRCQDRACGRGRAGRDQPRRPDPEPSKTKVKGFSEDLEYQAQSWDKPRRVDRAARSQDA